MDSVGDYDEHVRIVLCHISVPQVTITFVFLSGSSGRGCIDSGDGGRTDCATMNAGSNLGGKKAKALTVARFVCQTTP